jgi:hypothetical protein
MAYIVMMEIPLMTLTARDLRNNVYAGNGCL